MGIVQNSCSSNKCNLRYLVSLSINQHINNSDNHYCEGRVGVSSDRIDSNSSKSNMKSIKADKENKEKSVSKREREKTCPDRRRYLMQIPIK